VIIRRDSFPKHQKQRYTYKALSFPFGKRRKIKQKVNKKVEKQKLVLRRNDSQTCKVVAIQEFTVDNVIPVHSFENIFQSISFV
jgi:hypothetical protein